MRWEGERQSENVEDRRGMSGGVMAGGGGIVALVIGLIVYFVTGRPPQNLGPAGPQDGAAQSGAVQQAPANDRMSKFVSTVLASTEDVWTDLFRKRGWTYKNPKLVLFTGQVQSACGSASSAVGPFYCPGDFKLYIDLEFFRELETRYRAPGDFAQAYVIAHEVGHHVQRLLGTTDRVDRDSGGGKTKANQLSVRLELQADFYAGVWAHHAQKQKKWLEPGDIEEALKAAFAVGDDTIQKRGRGTVVPDSFTHGSAAQRMAWFKKGFLTGDISQGDTFTMPDP
ncbi:MAG TPA: neutral zinc metallopeptidase [Tepidisphaeraceae bacterium]|nr:neutral zinc metallopeptidase [Tepidisphaeraceae bacterium]